MDKVEISLENLIGVLSENIYMKNFEWSLRDFNNVESADRKLIINKKLSFWVHDEALKLNSDYFSELFEKKFIADNSFSNNSNIESFSQNNMEKNQKKNEKYDSFFNDEIIETEIELPNENLFFDVLIWIYTKDHKKLKKASKNFHLFINFISMGISLRMKKEFFDILLNKIEFEWKSEYFNDESWSKNTFTFPILERIVDQMNADKYTKLIALLSWLKSDEIYNKKYNDCDQMKKIIQKKDKITEYTHCESRDVFFVRNYIIKMNLTANIKSKQIISLKKKFGALNSVFDTNTLIDEYIFCSSKQLICLVCKKSFNSPFELQGNLECKGEYYHPRYFSNLNSTNMKNEKNTCLHENCKKKFSKVEFSCCHKNNSSIGCTLSDGKHQLVIIEFNY